MSKLCFYLRSLLILAALLPLAKLTDHSTLVERISAASNHSASSDIRIGEGQNAKGKSQKELQDIISLDDVIKKRCIYCNDGVSQTEKMDSAKFGNQEYSRIDCIDVCRVEEGKMNDVVLSYKQDYGRVHLKSLQQCKTIINQLVSRETKNPHNISLQDFVESFIYDEVSQMCYTRDISLRRNLQRPQRPPDQPSTTSTSSDMYQQYSESCAKYTDCFNCSFTGGVCTWYAYQNKCAYVNITVKDSDKNWPSLYSSCSDDYGLCKSNVNSYSEKSTGVISGQKYYFQIAPNTTDFATLPQNYFCNWTFNIDSANTYSMIVNRYMSYSAESLTIRVKNDLYEDILTDKQLQISDGSTSTSLRILNPKIIYIYARNIVQQQNETFLVTVEAETSSDSSSVFGVISLVLFILMAIFICICIAAIIRVCLRKRRYEQNLQNQIRSRENQDQEALTNEQRMDQLIGMIKEKKYDKRMDEFKQNECVICFEEFQKSVLVRKIPICRHIFHTSCIDGWFKSKITDISHKCPLCNSDITLEKVKEALKKRKVERDLKRQGKLNNAILPILDKSNPSFAQQNQQNMTPSIIRSVINENVAQIAARQNRAGADIQRMGVIEYQNNSNTALLNRQSGTDQRMLSNSEHNQARNNQRTIQIQPVFENNSSSNINGVQMPFIADSRVIDL